MAFPIAPSVNDVYVNGGVQYKWNGYAWDVVNTIGTASMFTYEYIATAGQTVFNVNYYAASKYLDVYLNGVRLANSEYTAVDGSTVVLTAGATAGDVFTAKVYDMVEFTDALTSETAYTKVQVQGSLPKVGFDTANVTAPSTGQLAWNAADRTLDIGLGNGVTLQAGQETVYLVRNATGSQIDDGTVVVASGVTAGSGRISVSKAIADGSISATKLVGIATENIANDVNGVVTSFGYVRGLDTRGTAYGETWAEGDILYVSQTTAGRLTNVMPVSGQKIIVAMVIVVHATSGVVFVRASNLDENKWAEINDGTVSTTATWSSQKIDTDKQDTLVSGTSIKTVNGASILGSGDIVTPTTTLASVAPIIAGTAAVGVSTAAARQDHVHPAQTTITGNAATATKLAATKTISGVAFDGSANINIEDRLGTPIVSAATTTVGTAGLGDYVHITGTTTITSLGTAATAGIRRTLIFDGALKATTMVVH